MGKIVVKSYIKMDEEDIELLKDAITTFNWELHGEMKVAELTPYNLPSGKPAEEVTPKNRIIRINNEWKELGL
jgi:hypothetical protein